LVVKLLLKKLSIYCKYISIGSELVNAVNHLIWWFSNFLLKGAKSRLMTWLESRTKVIWTQVDWHVWFYCRM